MKMHLAAYVRNVPRQLLWPQSIKLRRPGDSNGDTVTRQILILLGFRVQGSVGCGMDVANSSYRISAQHDGISGTLTPWRDGLGFIQRFAVNKASKRLSMF